MNREAREARLRGAGTRRVAPVNIVIQGTTPGSSVASNDNFRDQQKEAQTPTPFERGQKRRQTDVMPSLNEAEVFEPQDHDDPMEEAPMDYVEEANYGAIETPHALPVRVASSSPPEFNLTRDFEEQPPDEDELDLSMVLPREFDVSDSDEEFVPQELSDLEEPREKTPPLQSQASRKNYADRIKTYTVEEAEESEAPSSFRNTGSARGPKRSKAIALEVTQLDTDEPEFSPRVTCVDFVSQMVLETLEQELGKNVDEEQREVIEKYSAELRNRFLELSDMNNAVYMQKTHVAKLTRTKNSAQEALLKVNERLNEARVETDRKGREFASKKRTWDDTRALNEFLHDVEDVNNSLRGVESSGVTVTPSVFDKLAHIEEQTQLLGKLRQLNGMLDFACQKLSS
ncbi:hypothetical protein CJU89_2744 [Yarrowia sp. B02]|nr:hypothetical protein CJU89_2744 [Yarrowia sp. B02]